MEQYRILILKTNIISERMVRPLAPIFNEHEAIQDWSIDLEDVDKVLRIESKPDLTIREVVTIIAEHGHYGEDLRS